jgi:hypothetical protein
MTEECRPRYAKGLFSREETRAVRIGYRERSIMENIWCVGGSRETGENKRKTWQKREMGPVWRVGIVIENDPRS